MIVFERFFAYFEKNQNKLTPDFKAEVIKVLNNRKYMRYTHGYLSKIDGVGENVQLNDGSIDIGDIGFDNEEAKHVDIADPA